MHTIIALPITTRDQREAWLASAHNNIFFLNPEDITIDLFDRQWHRCDVRPAMGRDDAWR
jgi:tryptophanase